MKYRKKPVIVEVTGQFFENSTPWPEGVHRDAISCYVVTIHEQITRVTDGDWVIEEPDGEHHYPCKPDIFKQTYELVEG